MHAKTMMKVVLIIVIASCSDNNVVFLEYKDVDGVWEKQNEVK